MDANYLVSAIRNVLIRTGLKLSHSLGQCYNGASKMKESRSVVATQLQAEESRAVVTHCCGQSLNLAIGNTVKQSKVCTDDLDIAFEISKLIGFSPKTNSRIERVRVVNPTHNEGQNVEISAFCATRKTACGEAI